MRNTQVHKNWIIKQMLIDKVGLLLELDKGSPEFRESMRGRISKLLKDVAALIKDLDVEE